MYYYAVTGAYSEVMDGLLYGVISTLTAIREGVNEQSHVEALKGGFGSLCLKS